MVFLMNRNSLRNNSDSFATDFAKELLDYVVGQKDENLESVVEEVLYNNMEAALNSCSNNSGNQRVGKLHHCEKLVDIWLVFKDMPELLTKFSCPARRATSLVTFIGVMEKFDYLAASEVSANRSKARGWKSAPFPIGEEERRFLEQGGFPMICAEIPHCVNPKCCYQFIDQPASNKTVDAEN